MDKISRKNMFFRIYNEIKKVFFFIVSKTRLNFIVRLYVNIILNNPYTKKQ